MSAVSLTPEQAENLSGALERATKQLAETRVEMDKRQVEISSALKRVDELEKKGVDKNSPEYREMQNKLNGLADQVCQLAEQNTNLLALTRRQSVVLANSGSNPNLAYRPAITDPTRPNRSGAVFASRKQAVELGYFFMATMRPQNSAQQYARQWLSDRQKDLEYLPNMPASLIQLFGASHQETIKRCMSKGFEYGAEALATNVTPGSVLTFPQFADTFIRNVELYGAFRQNALVWPMGADTVMIPRRTAGMTPYWIGEASALTASDPTFDLLRFVVKKIAMMHQYSSELAQDEAAAIALADLIMFEMSLAFATEEDRIGFTGTGLGGNSPGFAGFWGVLGLDRQSVVAEASEDKNKCLSITGATGLDRTDEITLKGLRQIIGACHTWALPNAKWYAHRTVLQDLYGVETTGGGPITSSDVSNRTTLLGYPVVASEAFPLSPGSASTAVFAFGDLRKSWLLGDRRAPEVETSEHYAFNTDQLTLRALSRIAIGPTSPTGMVVYVTAA